MLKRKKIRQISQLEQDERSFLFMFAERSFCSLVVDLEAAVRTGRVFTVQRPAGWLAVQSGSTRWVSWSLAVPERQAQGSAVNREINETKTPGELSSQLQHCQPGHSEVRSQC